MVVYEYLYRQINDKGGNTIDFLLNREEAHNALFREALNKLQDTDGSLKDFGVTQDSKLYFDLSSPDRYFADPRPTPPQANQPRQDLH